ncbi:MAG: FAD-binding oxidoreductase [Alphaproteobacteria bacterium]|nr:FAD-binding oxidoreductase [Alphaproteobacteria bacterium]
MTQNYDIIIFGGGIAGLFIASRLQRAGYNLILIEKDRLGGTQTLASQGMLHGGQKYALGGGGNHATSIAAMPARWEACFAGQGEIDLSAVKFLSAGQVMFPAGSFFSSLSVIAAAHAVRGRVQRLQRGGYPAVLQRGPVYEMQEKVLETKSLIAALAQNLKGRIFRGEVQEIAPDGRVVVSGIPLQAKAVIFTAGAGNETALSLLQIKEQHTQRRPLRQIMVKSLPQALYGHGIVGQPKPRVTVTSHPLSTGGYVWYLGGNVAEEGAKLSAAEALAFAKKEMQDIFPHLDWEQKEWASWLGDRAEPFDAEGQLPPGPYIQQRGKVLIAWPTKLTFAPALADQVFALLQERGVSPSPSTASPLLDEAEIGHYPWEEAQWQRI